MPLLPATELKQAPPLCIDLDGTLIKTDLLWESFIHFIKHNPSGFLLVPFWLLRGRAHLKSQLAGRVRLDASALPYNDVFVNYLRNEKERGRRLILVTAADSVLARGVAEHLGFFDEVLASDGKLNLKGGKKAATLAERYSPRGFDYAGNSAVDLAVWRQARQALVVNGTANLVARAGQVAEPGAVFELRKSRLKALARALRPHQWIKNFIVFVPLLTSHQITDASRALQAIFAFLCFSLCASGVYLLNDLVDLEADRQHAAKRARPLATGDLPLPYALAAIPVLLLGAVLVSSNLGWRFCAVLGAYFLATTAYSFRLKSIPLLDVFVLAGLYTIRLIAGHEAAHVEYSFWLLVFSMFIFLSLALVKRFVELSLARQRSKAEIKGRGYTAADLELVAMLGVTSGYLSALVLALYANSLTTTTVKTQEGLYQHPIVLLSICPLLLSAASGSLRTADRCTMTPSFSRLKIPRVMWSPASVCSSCGWRPVVSAHAPCQYLADQHCFGPRLFSRTRPDKIAIPFARATL